MILAVDIGAPFTEFVLLNDNVFRSHKIFSATHTPAETILNVIHELELSTVIELGALLIVHNGDEATNAMLQKIGAGTLSIKDHPITARYLTQLLKTPSALIMHMSSAATTFSAIENNTPITEESIIIGGESIAYLDENSLLNIKSATSTHPYSACYGLGNDQPTITDANLILGRLRPDTILGNACRPDVNAARMALAKLAGVLNKRVEDTALEIVNMANQKMIIALQLMLSGHNTSPHTLCAVGGYAGLHICALADALNIKNVIVPLFAGVFSAVDLLMTAAPNVSFPSLDYKKKRASHYRIQLHGITLPVSVWQHDELSPEEMIMGPAIIIENTSTTFLQNGWLAYVDPVGHLLLRRMAIDVY
jgi:N-methylhydantoinase A/oxoprolinase/acetone carboxylase beta subunit